MLLFISLCLSRAQYCYTICLCISVSACGSGRRDWVRCRFPSLVFSRPLVPRRAVHQDRTRSLWLGPPESVGPCRTDWAGAVAVELPVLRSATLHGAPRCRVAVERRIPGRHTCQSYWSAYTTPTPIDGTSIPWEIRYAFNRTVQAFIIAYNWLHSRHVCMCYTADLGSILSFICQAVRVLDIVSILHVYVCMLYANMCVCIHGCVGYPNWCCMYVFCVALYMCVSVECTD